MTYHGTQVSLFWLRRYSWTYSILKHIFYIYFFENLLDILPALEQAAGLSVPPVEAQRVLVAKVAVALKRVHRPKIVLFKKNKKKQLFHYNLRETFELNLIVSSAVTDTALRATRLCISRQKNKQFTFYK